MSAKEVIFFSSPSASTNLPSFSSYYLPKQPLSRQLTYRSHKYAHMTDNLKLEVRKTATLRAELDS